MMNQGVSAETKEQRIARIAAVLETRTKKLKAAGYSDQDCSFIMEYVHKHRGYDVHHSHAGFAIHWMCRIRYILENTLGFRESTVGEMLELFHKLKVDYYASKISAEVLDDVCDHLGKCGYRTLKYILGRMMNIVQDNLQFRYFVDVLTALLEFNSNTFQDCYGKTTKETILQKTKQKEEERQEMIAAKRIETAVKHNKEILVVKNGDTKASTVDKAPTEKPEIKPASDAMLGLPPTKDRNSSDVKTEGKIPKLDEKTVSKMRVEKRECPADRPAVRKEQVHHKLHGIPTYHKQTLVVIGNPSETNNPFDVAFTAAGL